MKIAWALASVISLLVAACAGIPPSFDEMPHVACPQMLGPGWTPLAAAPDNAAELLDRLASPPTDTKRTRWYGAPDGALALCEFGVCGGGEAHVFRRSGPTWNVEARRPDTICVA